MKLLEKSQLNNLKQTEQKTIIDSGVALARKIDVLRVELLDMEKNRADFINGSRSELENAIKDLRTTKGILDSEITEQRKLLAKLREPLDEEWHKLSIGQTELSELYKKADAYFSEVVEERKVLQEKTKKVDSLLEISYKQKNESDKLIKESEIDRRKAKEVLTQSENIKDIYSVEKYNENIRLGDWDKNLKKREEKLNKEQELFNEEKKELEIKKNRWKI